MDFSAELDSVLLMSESDDEALFNSSTSRFRASASPRTPPPFRESADQTASIESSIGAVSLSATFAPRSPSPNLWESREASERKRWARSTPVRQKCEGTPLRCALPNDAERSSASSDRDDCSRRALAFSDDDDDDDDDGTFRDSRKSRVSDEHRAAAFGSFNCDDDDDDDDDVGGSGGGDAAAASPAAASPAPATPARVAADEWREARDAAGDAYFYNRRTRRAVWALPRGSVRVVGADARERIYAPRDRSEPAVSASRDAAIAAASKAALAAAEMAKASFRRPPAAADAPRTPPRPRASSGAAPKTPKTPKTPASVDGLAAVLRKATTPVKAPRSSPPPASTPPRTPDQQSRSAATPPRAAAILPTATPPPAARCGPRGGGSSARRAPGSGTLAKLKGRFADRRPRSAPEARAPPPPARVASLTPADLRKASAPRPHASARRTPPRPAPYRRRPAASPAAPSPEPRSRGGVVSPPPQTRRGQQRPEPRVFCAYCGQPHHGAKLKAHFDGCGDRAALAGTPAESALRRALGAAWASPPRAIVTPE